MPNRPTYLIDRDNARVASLDVRGENGLFEGSISLESSPARVLFERYEEIVEGQIFGLLDEIEDRIDSLGLRIVFEDGAVADVDDLQVFPSTRAVSFAAQQPSAVR